MNKIVKVPWGVSCSVCLCECVCVVGGVMNNYTSFIHSFIHSLAIVAKFDKACEL